jgi:hypothetical protein
MRQVLESFILERFSELHTAMPGAVDSFDVSKQTANVKLLLKRKVQREDGTVADESLGVAVNVPIVWPAAGGFRLTFPLKQGDGVLIIFAEASIDLWQELGGEQATDSRRFHLADAIAVPGLLSTKKHGGFSADAMTLGSDTGPGIVLRESTVELGAREGSPASQAVLLGNDTTAAFDSLTTALLTQVTAIVTALGIASASLAAAAVANAVPIVGGILAAAPLGVVVTQLGLIASQLGAMISSITQLKTTLPTLHSQIVKTR